MPFCLLNGSDRLAVGSLIGSLIGGCSAGCPDFLYLFQHCATKSMCEAVVEGMGGCWDTSSPDDRHPSFESGDEQRTQTLQGITKKSRIL
jgi:hypothetical protein